MWAFAGFVTESCVPRCYTSILKVAKLIFVQVTNLLNGYCYLGEEDHSKLIWLNEGVSEQPYTSSPRVSSTPDSFVPLPVIYP